MLPRQQGFALLLVLWALVALTLIVTHLLAASRSETQLAGNLRASAAAEAVADGAVQDVLFHLASGTHGPDALVARAVTLAVQAGADQDSGPLPTTAVQVTATATATVAGGRFVRRATARLHATDGTPFRIVTWGAEP